MTSFLNVFPSDAFYFFLAINENNFFIGSKTLYICSMIQSSFNSAKIAEFLLQIKAIKLQPKEPFTWASGWKSPIYCDNRKY